MSNHLPSPARFAKLLDRRVDAVQRGHYQHAVDLRQAGNNTDDRAGADVDLYHVAGAEVRGEQQALAGVQAGVVES